MLLTKRTYIANKNRIAVISIKLDDPESLTWGIFMVGPPSTSTPIQFFIDWGDGNFGKHDLARMISHDYAKPGNYTVTVYSAASVQLSISGPTAGTPWHDEYPKRVTAIMINGMFRYAQDAFANTTELTTLDIQNYANTLPSKAFADSHKLTGAVNLKPIRSLAPDVFEGCELITELHFHSAYESYIKQCPGYSDGPGNFGAPNAVCVFDLT